MVGGGLAAAVVVALRIPTNPRHSCGEVVHGPAPAPKVRSFKADGSYQVKRNGQWVASDASGQPTAAPLSGAPDTVGRRQEYTAGMKQIAADLARLRSTDNLDASLDQFDTANSQVSTGPEPRQRQPQPGQPSQPHGPELQRYTGRPPAFAGRLGPCRAKAQCRTLSAASMRSGVR